MNASHTTLLTQARTAVRMIDERKRSMDTLAQQTRDAARVAGKTVDCRIDYAQGSADAYSIAVSIILGAFGYPDLETMIGYTPATSEPLPPMLPDPDATQSAEGDDIALAAIIKDRTRDDG